MANITLCTIVKDEAHNLPGLLESVRGVVDDVVVVDTGSNDETVAIAQRAGARIVHHPWDDDFAAARNAGIATIEGGFVLILDADERLAPGAGEVLRQAVAANRIDGGRLALYNASQADATAEEVLSGAKRMGPPIKLERFLRCTPDLRWQGVVHEHVTAWALNGKRLADVEASIIHYGATEEVRQERGKAARNLRLLEVAVEREPKNPVYKTYLAQDLLQDGQTDRARVEVEEAWSLLERAKKNQQATANPIPTATLRTVLLLEENRFEECLDTLQKARRWGGEHPNVSFLTALVHERRWLANAKADSQSPLLESAVKACEHCFAMADQAFDTAVLPGATSWAAATRLGTVRLLQNQPNAAQAAFERAIAARSLHLEALLGQSEAILRLGLVGPALQSISPLLHAELPDAWILAAWAGFQVGGSKEVAPMVEQARRSLSSQPCLAPHRLWILEELESEAQRRKGA